MATQISLESDRSFADYDTALAHVTGPPLPPETTVVWNQVMLDVLFDYPIQSDRSEFSIHPGLARLGLRVVTVLRFLPPTGVVRAFEYDGDPGLVRLDPRWYQAALRFVNLGFFHILDGTDHLLFLFCLVIPFRRFGALIPIVTSFTVAHSITLIASAYNFAPDALWFPPLIETLIAMSIVYMALENIVGTSNVHRRWMITFGFGLVHGFGFSFVLRQTMQFAGSHMLTSLLSFNVGVELGQLLVLVLLIPVLELLFRYVVAERMGTIILSALVAHTGWHWMIDRGSQLSQFRFQWPVITAALLVTLMHWLMAIVFLAGLLWVVFGVLRPRAARQREANMPRERRGQSRGHRRRPDVGVSTCRSALYLPRRYLLASVAGRQYFVWIEADHQIHNLIGRNLAEPMRRVWRNDDHVAWPDFAADAIQDRSAARAGAIEHLDNHAGVGLSPSCSR